MLMKIGNKIRNMPLELKLFFATLFLFGIGASMVDAVFNNFLNERFMLSGFQRAIIEFPRELPGFLTAFISAALFFLFSRRLAALTFIFQAVGIILIGFIPTNFGTIMIWLFIFSMGQHMFMPLNSSIAMELAKDNEMGKRLGQANGIKNLAMVLGTIIIFLGFKFLNFNFEITFIIAAFCFISCALILLKMKKGEKHDSREHLKIYPKYKLYYWLCILYGSRKQIFITFAPWVMVTVFHRNTQTIAMLLTIGAVIGVLYQPWLGKAIDKFGEKKILAAESILLIFVCAGYGLSKHYFNEETAFIIAAICYILDQMLMSVSMARTTYLKKISEDHSHIKPTLSMAITLDHIFSIIIAVAGGFIWDKLDYRWVFLAGALIAVINFISVMKIKIEK